MQSDSSPTGTFELKLPKDLLQEAARAHGGRKDPMAVEGWQPSLIGRFMEMFAGNGKR
jgi:hypothetical protein